MSLFDPSALASVAATIEAWAARLDAAVEPIPADSRWLIRLRGVDKAITTVWLTLGERTLRYETYFMPAPEENLAETYEYLLRVNARLFGMRFAIGDEDAIYLMGQIPVSDVDDAALDRIIGTAFEYTEQYFHTALSIGFASRFQKA